MGLTFSGRRFLGNRSGYRIGIPRVPLGDLYEGCRDAIVKRGGEVELRRGVREIRIRENRFAHPPCWKTAPKFQRTVHCRCAAQRDFRHAPKRNVGLWRRHWRGCARHIKTSPITGVHFWYDRAVMREPFPGIVGPHATQWVFTNKSSLLYASADDGRATEAAKGQYLQLVISASYDLSCRFPEARDYRSLPPRTRGSSARDARSELGKGHGDQRDSRDVFS